MEDSFRFPWQSRILLFVVATFCIVVLWLWPASYPVADAVRGFCTSLLATLTSLILFYYVDPRLKRQTYEDVLTRSGLRQVGRNRDFEPAFWTDVISELPTAHERVFLVGKRLSDWRTTPVYSDPLLKGLRKRAENANGCKDELKYLTTIVVEESTAHDDWKKYLGEMATGTSRISLKKACFHVSYALIIVGRRMVVVPYVGNRTTGDTSTLDVLHDSDIWKLYARDAKELYVDT